ncbi:MAG TPA: hypothetical protein VF317_04875 [Dermatophilaceae bacterium]
MAILQTRSVAVDRRPGKLEVDPAGHHGEKCRRIRGGRPSRCRRRLEDRPTLRQE